MKKINSILLLIVGLFAGTHTASSRCGVIEYIECFDKCLQDWHHRWVTYNEDKKEESFLQECRRKRMAYKEVEQKQIQYKIDRLKSLQELIDSGINLDQCDQEGMTPLT